jgi:rare lipoprotein A
MKQISALLLAGLVFTAFAEAQTTAHAVLFRQEGIASWYGNEFDGRLTASGEVFKSSQFTAAHPSLPFGTLLLVTNIHNNNQVVVRVNDRGPFVPARIIDLSKAAAERLDMLATGTAPVVVELTNMPAGYYGQLPGSAPVQSLPFPAAPPPVVQQIPIPPPAPVYQPAPVSQPVFQAAPPAASYSPPLSPVYRPPELSRYAAEIKPALPAPGSGRLYRLQLGAYKIARNAVEAFDKLKSVGLNPVYEKNGDMYRVVLSGVRAEEVPVVAERLGTAGFREALIREEP